MLRICIAAMIVLSVSTVFGQDLSTPEGCLGRLQQQTKALLAKDQPPLFAWHLRSLRSLAESEYAKLTLERDQTPQRPVSLRTKEFVEYVSQFCRGLDGDAANPDAYLKEGRRSLVLARPSALDGTLRYTMVGLPKGWEPTRLYPLFVGLHGSGPDNPLAYPSFGSSPERAEPKIKSDSDMIHLTPWGRGNRGWRGDAETDLWEAISQLESFAKLDPDRWYLTGHSSGADGAWAIAQHTPDRWAAVGIQSGSMLAGPPEWGLIPNMAYVPTYFLIGADDNLPYRIPDMKEAHEIMKKLGAATELVILPGVGHYPLTEAALDAQTDWLVGHVRRRPDRFRFKVDQPSHPGVWGVNVRFDGRPPRLLLGPYPMFEVEVRGREVRVTTHDVKRLDVTLGKGGLGLAGKVRLMVNGKSVFDGEAGEKPVSVEPGS